MLDMCFANIFIVVLQCSLIIDSKGIKMDIFILVGIVFIGFCVVYALPCIVANSRNVRESKTITILSLLFGWTVVVWLVCIVWAVFGQQDE